MTAALARPAWLGPGLAPAAALGTGRADQHQDGDDRTAVGLVARETDLRLDRFGAFAGCFGEKRPADTRYEMSDRREVDRDLIRETIVLVFQIHAG
jgi:hypothetical protein